MPSASIGGTPTPCSVSNLRPGQAPDTGFAPHFSNRHAGAAGADRREPRRSDTIGRASPLPGAAYRTRIVARCLPLAGVLRALSLGSGPQITWLWTEGPPSRPLYPGPARL